jgi:cytochrome c6
MRRRRLAPLLAVLALSTSGFALAACGGSETPAGTVTGEITIGTEGEGTNPGGEAAGGVEEGAGTNPQGGTSEGEGNEEGAAGGTGATTEAAPGGDAQRSEGDAAAGKVLFTGEAGCGSCHALSDAGSNGAVGPNLDDAKPDYDRVVEYVTNGKGAMPSFKDRLSETDIQNVAAYVADVTGGG